MGERHLSKIIDVKPSDVSLKPMLLEFEHGTLIKEEVPKLRCDYLQRKDNPKDIFVLLNSPKAVYKYRGQKIDNESQLCQRFFVIRNKRTNKVRVASVDQLVVSRYLENVVLNDELNLSQTLIVDKEEDNLTELRKAFGSKRSQRGLEMEKRMKINTDAVKAKMETTALRVNVAANELNKNANSGSVLFPKCDRNATNIQDVYKIEDLFTSSAVLDSLSTVAQSAIDHCPKEPDSDYSKFFIDTMKMIPTMTVEKVKCLLYIDALLRFISMEAKKINSKIHAFSICPLSKELRKLVIENFSVFSQSGRTRPLFMRDKAVCFALVLLMIVFDYVLSEKFVFHLFPSISGKRVLQTGKAMGFTTRGDKWLLQLPLPQVQTTPKGRKKKSF